MPKLSPSVIVPVLAVFLAFSAWVVAVDPLGLLRILREPWGAQVALDLVVSLSVAWAFIARDARFRGVSRWPWLVATLFLGSPVVLLFLLVHGRNAAASRVGGDAEPGALSAR
ncbi:MAG: hypothetical protein WKG00_04870 [Polyangiaceae bacterium]